mmetsp:Transcript_30908/g.101924  ORF Transcript_30908/g.101924 Transcript_30908/m.101924 type:complete len:259 (-) Transcript_30908:1061-1837(-)
MVEDVQQPLWRRVDQRDATTVVNARGVAEDRGEGLVGEAAEDVAEEEVVQRLVRIVDEQLLERVGADVLEADDVEQHEGARLLAPLASRRGRGEVRVEPEHEEIEEVLVEVARQRVARLGGLARRERDLARRAAPSQRRVRPHGEGLLQLRRRHAERLRGALERRRLLDERAAPALGAHGVSLPAGGDEGHVAELEQAEQCAPHAGDVRSREAERRQRRLHHGQLRRRCRLARLRLDLAVVGAAGDGVVSDGVAGGCL